MSDLFSRCAVALLAVALPPAASAQLAPSGRANPSEPSAAACCLAPGWWERCPGVDANVRDEVHGPFHIGRTAVQARVRCRITTPGGASSRARELVSLELTEPSGSVLYRRDLRREASARSARLRLAAVRGDRGSGFLVQVTLALDPEGPASGSALTLLVRRGARMAPLGPELRIFGELAESSPEAASDVLPLRGDRVHVVVLARWVDASCAIPVDWTHGFRDRQRMTCDATADPSSVPRDGSVLLWDAPRRNAASRVVRVAAGVPVRVLRTRGRLVPSFAGPYRTFEDEWIEVGLGDRRGWVRRPEDVAFLGISVERC